MSDHTTKAERARLAHALREAQHQLRPLEHGLTTACQAFQLSGGRDKTPVLNALAKLERGLKHEAHNLRTAPATSGTAVRARSLAMNALHLFAQGVSDLDKAWVASDPTTAQHLAAQSAGHARHAQRLQRRVDHILRLTWVP